MAVTHAYLFGHKAPKSPNRDLDLHRITCISNHEANILPPSAQGLSMRWRASDVSVGDLTRSAVIPRTTSDTGLVHPVRPAASRSNLQGCAVIRRRRTNVTPFLRPKSTSNAASMAPEQIWGCVLGDVLDACAIRNMR